jgi:capsular polysaccharide biosynthesis protein
MTRPYGAPRGPFELETQHQLTPKQRLGLSVIGVLIVVAGIVSALALTLFSTTMYVARTELYFHLRVENATYFMRTDANLTNQTLLLTDHSVLGPVAAANGLTVDDLAKNVSATIVNNSDLIRVDVQDPDRNTGVLLADAIAKQYLTVLNNISPSVAVQQQIDAARSSLSSATPADVPTIQARIAMLQEQIDIINTSRNTAQIAVPAYSVDTPASPDRSLAVRVGAVIGAVLAALVCATLFLRWTAANLRLARARYGPPPNLPYPPARPAPARQQTET